MTTYALIENGKVSNIIVWEGPEVAPMEFGENITYAEFPDNKGNSPSIDWEYDGEIFSPPTLSKEEIASQEQAEKNANITIKQALIDEATTKITVWQTKLLVGRKLTDVETNSLNEWLDYIDVIDAVDANTNQLITWPSKPQ